MRMRGCNLFNQDFAQKDIDRETARLTPAMRLVISTAFYGGDQWQLNKIERNYDLGKVSIMAGITLNTPYALIRRGLAVRTGYLQWYLTPLGWAVALKSGITAKTMPDGYGAGLELYEPQIDPPQD